MQNFELQVILILALAIQITFYIDLKFLQSSNFVHEYISYCFFLYALLGERDGLQSQTAEFLILLFCHLPYFVTHQPFVFGYHIIYDIMHAAFFCSHVLFPDSTHVTCL